jgi:hypothetical protein
MSMARIEEAVVAEIPAQGVAISLVLFTKLFVCFPGEKLPATMAALWGVL